MPREVEQTGGDRQNSNLSSDQSEAAPSGEMPREVEQTGGDRTQPTIEGKSHNQGDDEPELLSQTELQQWLNSIASVKNAAECMDCLDALNALPPPVTEQIWNSADPLLPRFWEIAEIETIDEPHQNPAIGLGTNASGQQQANHDHDDAIAMPSSVEEPANCTVAIKDLITGLWVRTLDEFYGHLGAMTLDGRWWVLSPKTRKSDAQSRLYAATDIIPMPAS